MNDRPTPPLLLRSVLYVPASNRRALEKAPALDADAIVYDLEDAVAPDAKATARAQLAEALRSRRPRRTVIRVNAVDTPEFDADIALVAALAPDAILCPKPGSPDDIGRVVEAALRHAVPAGVGLWAMVESVAALTGLDAIVRAGLSATPRLEALVVGTNDLAKETGVDPGDGRRLLLPWLMNVVLVAKRHRVTLLDGVWNDFGDTDGFDAEAAQSVRMGFDGKTLIHPSQIVPTHRAFAPSAAALADAEAVVAAFARPEHAGAGVVALGGRMVERLHLAQAERLLARQAGIAAREAANAGVASPAPP